MITAAPAVPAVAPAPGGFVIPSMDDPAGDTASVSSTQSAAVAAELQAAQQAAHQATVLAPHQEQLNAMVPPAITAPPLAAAPAGGTSGDIPERIANRVAHLTITELSTKLDFLTNALAAQSSMLSHVLVQLDQVQTKASRPSASRTRSTPSGGAGGDDMAVDPEKVKNTWLYFRMIFLEQEAIRQAHMVVDPMVGKDQATLNHELEAAGANKTGGKKLAAQAKLIWSGYLSTARKDQYKTEFETWRQTRQASSIPAPLRVEGGANGAAPPMMMAQVGAPGGVAPYVAQPNLAAQQHVQPHANLAALLNDSGMARAF